MLEPPDPPTVVPAMPPAPALVRVPAAPALAPAVLCVAPPLPELESALLVPPLPVLETPALPVAMSAADPASVPEPLVASLELQAMHASPATTSNSPNPCILRMIAASIAPERAALAHLGTRSMLSNRHRRDEQLTCRGAW